MRGSDVSSGAVFRPKGFTSQVPYCHQSCNPARRSAHHTPGGANGIQRQAAHGHGIAVGELCAGEQIVATLEGFRNRLHGNCLLRTVTTYAAWRPCAAWPNVAVIIVGPRSTRSSAPRKRPQSHARRSERLFTQSVISPRPIPLLPSISSHESKDDENDQNSVAGRFARSCCFRCAGLRFHEERCQGRYQHDRQRLEARDADAAHVDPDDRCYGRVPQRATRSSSSNPNRIVPAKSGCICPYKAPACRRALCVADETDRLLARSSVTAKQVFASDGEATWQNPHADMILIRPPDRIRSIPLPGPAPIRSRRNR